MHVAGGKGAALVSEIGHARRRSGQRQALFRLGHRTEPAADSAGKETRMGLLDGKTAVITGGASGIGLATAAQFLDGGARACAVLIAEGLREDFDTAAIYPLDHISDAVRHVTRPGKLDTVLVKP